MKFQLATLLVLLCTSVHAVEQSQRRLNIQSKVDQYELLLSGNSGSIGGKPADLTAIKDFLGVLTNPIANECPTQKGTADVTVRENGQTRTIYLAQGIVSDGTHCVSVGGEGLMFFPVHRDFLIGIKQDGIVLRSPIKIFRQGVKLFELKKTAEGWDSEGTNMLLDWDFLERFENSLASFRVRFRVQPDAAKNKPKMVVQIGEQSYEFSKISNVLWAVKKPGQRWLEASDDWSFWYAFDNSILEDRYSSQIHALQEAGKDPNERLAIMTKLDSNYSRNLHDLYRHMVLSQNEDPELKQMAMQRLRQKPTLATARAMAQYLQVGDDEEFKKIAGQILKSQDPKGPLYRPTAPSDEKIKTIEYWTRWAEKAQSAP